MAQVSVRVPAESVAPMRDSLITLYRATAESLHVVLRAHGERRRSDEELREHRERLAELDALLESLGWTPARAADDVGLCGSADVLHDAAYGALIDAGERLAAACLRRGTEDDAGGEVEGIRALARVVIQLDRLLQRIDAAAVE